MSLDDRHIGAERLSRKFADTCVNGRRVELGSIIPSVIVFAVLLYELHQDASLTTIMLLAFIGMNLYAMLAAFFRPPQMALRNGLFSLRLGQSRLLCPAADVADLRREAQSVRLTLADISRVEPGAARQRMATLYSRAGCHIGLPAGIYTLDQVNQLRTALGMPEQAADAAGEQMDEFQSGVKSHRPLVTLSLIVACVIVYLAKAYQDQSLLGGTAESSIAWGANYGLRTLGGQWWRLVTYLFLHGGPFHILMNMWVLWDVGQLMERLVGRTAMAMIYFLAGIAGGMASVAFHPSVLSVGASGAVFGVIGALFGLLLHARDAVPPARLQQLRSGIIAFVIFNVIFGLSAQGIDVPAHAGGAIAGLLAGLIVLPARSPGHWLRLGLLTFVGTGAILLGARLLPPPPRDFEAVFREYPEKARQIFREYSGLVKKRSQGDLSARAFADQLESNVVVPWRELATEMTDAIKERPGASQQGKFEQYLRLQQESFEDLLAAVREGDNERFNQAREKAEAAETIANERNGKGEKEP
ncbi:MAG: rhomboid family intramembrane serine protease [Thermoguttaceae bacterium]